MIAAFVAAAIAPMEDEATRSASFLPRSVAAALEDGCWEEVWIELYEQESRKSNAKDQFAKRLAKRAGLNVALMSRYAPTHANDFAQGMFEKRWMDFSAC